MVPEMKYLSCVNKVHEGTIPMALEFLHRRTCEVKACLEAMVRGQLVPIWKQGGAKWVKKFTFLRLPIANEVFDALRTGVSAIDDQWVVELGVAERAVKDFREGSWAEARRLLNYARAAASKQDM